MPTSHRPSILLAGSITRQLVSTRSSGAVGLVEASITFPISSRHHNPPLTHCGRGRGGEGVRRPPHHPPLALPPPPHPDSGGAGPRAPPPPPPWRGGGGQPLPPHP